MSLLKSIGGLLFSNGKEVTIQGRGGATAWVVFDGTGVIIDSYNVSSVEHNGGSDFTIHFENEMDNDNYVQSGSVLGVDNATFMSGASVGVSTTLLSGVSFHTYTGSYASVTKARVVFHGGKV